MERAGSTDSSSNDSESEAFSRRGRPPLSKESWIVFPAKDGPTNVKFVFPRRQEYIDRAKQDKIDEDGSCQMKDTARMPILLKSGIGHCDTLSKLCHLDPDGMERVITQLKDRILPKKEATFELPQKISATSLHKEEQISREQMPKCSCPVKNKKMCLALGMFARELTKPSIVTKQTGLAISEVYKLKRAIKRNRTSTIRRYMCQCTRASHKNDSLSLSVHKLLAEERPVIPNLHRLKQYLSTKFPAECSGMSKNKLNKLRIQLRLKKRKLRVKPRSRWYAHADIAKEVAVRFFLKSHLCENRILIFDVTSFGAASFSQHTWAVPGGKPTVTSNHPQQYVHLLCLIDRDNIKSLMLTKRSVTAEITHSFLVQSLQQLPKYDFLLLDNAGTNSITITQKLMRVFSIQVVYNFPSFPEYNSIEWVFGSIKSSVRTLLQNGQFSMIQCLEIVISRYIESGIDKISSAVFKHYLAASTNFGAR